MIAIIILNWNGWHDTIECIKSILKVNNVELSIVVVDNGSTDESVEHISLFINQCNNRTHYVNEGEELHTRIQNKDIVFYKLHENYGFAKGNNLGLQLVKSQDIEYYWILNNDTVIDCESIGVLKSFMDNNCNYYACTPQIRYYNPNNRIWNCGGKIFFGFRKYYFEGKNDVVFNNKHFNISFVTGCALFIRAEILDKEGKLFTENFFFGEEDFEFSLRMKKQKKFIACCTDSIIYHKVSASTKNKSKIGVIYIHYLNRYINIKHFFPNWQYFIWRKISNCYIAILLVRKGYSLFIIRKFIQKLKEESQLYDKVSKEMFDEILKLSRN